MPFNLCYLIGCCQGWFSPGANSEMASKAQTANRGCSGDRPFSWRRGRKQRGPGRGAVPTRASASPTESWGAARPLGAQTAWVGAMLRRLTPTSHLVTCSYISTYISIPNNTTSDLFLPSWCMFTNLTFKSQDLPVSLSNFLTDVRCSAVEKEVFVVFENIYNS